MSPAGPAPPRAPEHLPTPFTDQELRERIRTEILAELQDRPSATVASAESRARQILIAARKGAGARSVADHSAERAQILGWFGLKILDFGGNLPLRPMTCLMLCDVHDIRRYVAMARGESHLRMETPGLRFLRGTREPVPLSPAERESLRSAGWHEPAVAAGRPNWWADVEHRTDVDDLAYMAGVALREIHRVRSAVDIEYTTGPD